MKPDDALTVWSSVGAALGGMEDLEAGQSGRPAFEAYVRRVLAPVMARVGWDAKPGEGSQTESLRSDLIETLGNAGDPAVIAEAKTRFSAFVANPASLSPALRQPVLDIAGSYGDEATWTALHDLFVKSTNPIEGRQYFVAMCRARDPQLAAKNLAMATQLPTEMGGEIGYIDVLTVALGGRQPDAAWAYFKAHSSDLSGKISAFMRPAVVAIVAPLFWNAAPADELNAYINSVPDVPPAQAAKAKHAIDVRLKQRAQLLPSIDAAVKGV